MKEPLKLKFPAGFEGAVIEHDERESWLERPVAYTMLITDAQALVQVLKGWEAGDFRAVTKADYERGNA